MARVLRGNQHTVIKSCNEHDASVVQSRLSYLLDTFFMYAGNEYKIKPITFADAQKLYDLNYLSTFRKIPLNSRLIEVHIIAKNLFDLCFYDIDAWWYSTSRFDLTK